MSAGKQAKICKWKAIFKLTPERIGVAQVKDIPEVRLVAETIGNNTFITSIEITTSDMSFVDAVNYSNKIANRCVDFISSLVGYGASCSLGQINEIGPPRTVKEEATSFGADCVLSRLQNVDITTSSFSNALHDKDTKLTRQLSHYRRGLASSDVIEKTREFYLVLEDEYSENHPFRQKYRYVRHLVSHADLTDPHSAEEAKRIVGKSYLDPSVPEDMRALEKHLDEIKNEAERVIKSSI